MKTPLGVFVDRRCQGLDVIAADEGSSDSASKAKSNKRIIDSVTVFQRKKNYIEGVRL